jgi:hypothetical protein
MRCGTGQIEHGVDLCVVQWSYPELARHGSDQLRSRIGHQRTSSPVCAKTGLDSRGGRSAATDED